MDTSSASPNSPESESQFIAPGNTLNDPTSREGQIEQELTGLAYLEARFSNDPEAMAANTAMALLESLEHTGNVLRSGLEHDIPIYGQKSQIFLINTVAAITDAQSNPGFTQLLTGLSETSEGPNEHLCEYLQDFTKELQAHFENFNQLSFLEKYAEATNMQYLVFYLQNLTESFLNPYFEELLLDNEVAGMPKLDQELVRDYVLSKDPVYFADMFEKIVTGKRRGGFSAPVLIRLIEVAREAGVPGAEQVTLQGPDE